MRIGDLVRYARDIQGFQGIYGFIVDFNGDAVEVRWFNHCVDLTTELPEFIEVVNEAG